MIMIFDVCTFEVVPAILTILVEGELVIASVHVVAVEGKFFRWCHGAAVGREVSVKFSREFISAIMDKTCEVPTLTLSDRGLNICKWHVGYM